MIVHGIPGSYRLERGDILSVDIGVVKDGWVADAARTFPVGPISPVAQKLLDVTEESLQLAVAQCVAGNRLGDVVARDPAARRGGRLLDRAHARRATASAASMHEDPQIPNYGKPGTGVLLEEGMVLAVEPMVTVGTPPVRMGDDTGRSTPQDGSLAAHFEFTIAITADGPRILTPWHEATGGRAAA